MAERILGSYPGGPRRAAESAGEARPRLEGVEERQDRLSRRELERGRRRRSRRVLLGFCLAMLVAAAIGFAVGAGSRTTAAELTEAQDADRRRDLDISREVNRTLLQLWKMEEAEAARGGGSIR